MRKTLIFHIGTHKTGTTSLQSCLRENHEYLKSCGIFVRMEDRGPPHAKANNQDLAHAFLRRNLASGYRLTTGAKHTIFVQLKRAWRFRRQLKKLDSSCCVVSAEAFCFARTRWEQLLLRLCTMYTGYDVKVIVVRRSKEGWQRSWNNQLMKNPRIKAHFDQHDYPTRIDKSWYYEFDKILEFWNGVGDVAVVDYEEALKNDGSVIPSILRLIGAPEGLQQPAFLNKGVY